MSKRRFIFLSICGFTLAAAAIVITAHGTKTHEIPRFYAAFMDDANIKTDDDFFTKTDKIRAFVHGHSIHKIDAEFYTYWGNDRVISARIADKIAGRSATGPHLECSSRSGIMEQMLSLAGYKTRSVVLYKHKDGFPAHVFLEVQNPQDGAWHIQDPDYDVYWRITKNGRRANAADLITLPKHAYEPCLNAKNCGWDISNDEHRQPKALKEGLGLAVINDYQPHHRRSLIVNTARFDLEAPVMARHESLAFCRFAPQNCAGDIQHVSLK